MQSRRERPGPPIWASFHIACGAWIIYRLSFPGWSFSVVPVVVLALGACLLVALTRRPLPVFEPVLLLVVVLVVAGWDLPLKVRFAASVAALERLAAGWAQERVSLGELHEGDWIDSDPVDVGWYRVWVLSSGSDGTSVLVEGARAGFEPCGFRRIPKGMDARRVESLGVPLGNRWYTWCWSVY